MPKRIKFTYQNDAVDRKRAKRIAAILADGVYSHLRKRGLLKGSGRRCGGDGKAPNRRETAKSRPESTT